jgi:hypothetical protein
MAPAVDRMVARRVIWVVRFLMISLNEGCSFLKRELSELVHLVCAWPDLDQRWLLARTSAESLENRGPALLAPQGVEEFFFGAADPGETWAGLGLTYLPRDAPPMPSGEVGLPWMWRVLSQTRFERLSHSGMAASISFGSSWPTDWCWRWSFAKVRFLAGHLPGLEQRDDRNCARRREGSRRC